VILFRLERSVVDPRASLGEPFLRRCYREKRAMSNHRDDRRTMPPLPAAGTRSTTSHGTSSELSGKQEASDAGVAGSAADSPLNRLESSTSPLNMALAELQEELETTDEVVATPTPAMEENATRAAATSDPAQAPPKDLHSASTASSTARGPLAPDASAAAALTDSEPVGGSAPANSAPALSSTPPIAGSIPRPPERPQPPLTVPTPTLTSAPSAAPSHASESNHSLAPILVGGTLVWFLFGMLGAWAYDQFIRKPETPLNVAASSELDPDEERQVEFDPASLDPVLDPLKSKLGDLDKQIRDFETQLAAASKAAPADPSTAAPAVDLGPLQKQLDELTNSLAGAGGASEKLQSLDTKLGSLESSLTSIKGTVGELEGKAADAARDVLAMAPAAPRTEGPKPVMVPAPESTPAQEAAPKPNATPEPPPDLSPKSDSVAQAESRPLTPAPLPLENEEPSANTIPGLDEGVNLFKQGKYQEAFKVFEKLATTNGQDARVWYYAALSHGIATRDWGPATTKLLVKGIQQEKAGSPSSEVIDAAFRDLTSGTGKEWLLFKRTSGLK